MDAGDAGDARVSQGVRGMWADVEAGQNDWHLAIQYTTTNGKADLNEPLSQAKPGDGILGRLMDSVDPGLKKHDEKKNQPNFQGPPEVA